MIRRRTSVTLLLTALLGLAVAVARPGAASPFLRVVAVHGVPRTIALDARTGRAFICTSIDDHNLNGSVAVLDTHSGQLLRTVSTGDHPACLLVDEQTGRAFVLDEKDGTVSVLNTHGGALVHVEPIGQLLSPDERFLVLDAGTARAFMAWGNGISVLDARTGRTRATVDFLGGALVVDARVGQVFALGDHRVSVLDAQSGAMRRTTPLPIQPYSLVVDARTGRVFAVAATAIGVLDARTGMLLRTVPLSPNSFQGYFSAVIDEQTGRLFVGGTRGVSVFATATGAVVRFAPTGQADRAPVVAHRAGRVFVVAGHHVVVLDAWSGAQLHTVAVSSDANVAAVDERAGRVYVTRTAVDQTGGLLPAGSVSVLDAHGGTVLRTITLDGAPEGVAVDERSERVFIPAAGGSVAMSDPWCWVPSWLRSWVPFLPPPGPRTRLIPSHVYVLDGARYW